VPELRDVRARDAIRAFERAGGTATQGRGDHVKIRMPNGQLVVLADTRKPVKVGLLVAMIKRAGLTLEEFARLVQGESVG
jgi:predicted RNA binding protein YcfA (HicA-like mRNA interferase family)